VRPLLLAALAALACRSTPPAATPPAPAARAPTPTPDAAPTPTPDTAPAVTPERLTVELVARHPHDPEAFTQGLEFDGPRLLESTGLYGRSSLREVTLATGEVTRQHVVPRAHFAEGITVFRGRVYQLTYQTHVCFVYDAATFAPLREFELPGEGWGLTHDDRQLILSDGSAELRMLDPETFRELRRVTVRDGDRPVTMLNELELIDGAVWANIWQTDRIARIDPATGRVTAWIDASPLRREVTVDDGDGVLNGIAWDAVGRRLYLTGKLWPALFEVRTRPAG
jgi:glutamine cyclotransferase